MGKVNFLAFLSLFLAVSLSSAVDWTDCGSKTGKVADVQVQGCEGATDKCILKKGTSVAFTIKFKAGTNTSSLTADVHGYVSGVPLPFAGVQKDACVKCGLQCPLVSGKMYLYSTQIKIETFYPSLDVDVKWELQDDGNKDSVCVMIPVTLQ